MPCFSKSCFHASLLCPHQCGRHAGDVLELLVAQEFWCLLTEMNNWTDLTKYIILSGKHIHYYLNNLLYTLSSGYQGYKKYFSWRKIPCVKGICLHYQSYILGLVILMFAKALCPDLILSIAQICSVTSVISFLYFCQSFF